MHKIKVPEGIGGGKCNASYIELHLPLSMHLSIDTCTPEKRQIKVILLYVLRVHNLLGILIGRKQTLVLLQLLPLTVWVVDAPQTCNSKLIQVDPLKMFISDGEILTAGCNNTPAEILLCCGWLQAAEVFAQCGHCQMQYGVKWTKHLPL